MRLSILVIFGIVLLASCKKDYACYGSETVNYELYKDSTLTGGGIFFNKKYEVFESCINCSEKDKDKLIQMIFDQIEREQESTITYYEEQGNPVKTITIEENELICEEN